jgi:hypothetical protein
MKTGGEKSPPEVVPKTPGCGTPQESHRGFLLLHITSLMTMEHTESPMALVPESTAKTASRRASEPPAMGERRARWGLGYQDKVATATVLDLLRTDIRNGTSDLEGIRLADLQAGRVDDSVIVSRLQVSGNSLKWSDAAEPVNWGELIGAEGLLRELAEGWTRLKAKWPEKTIAVRLTTNRPASTNKHPSQLITEYSVAEFFLAEWVVGPSSAANEAAKSSWEIIRRHTTLDEDAFADFVRASDIDFSYAEPPHANNGTYDSEMYRRQFDQLHKAIATWITNNPGVESIDRAYLLNSIGLPGFKPELIQRFPPGQIPYERNSESAKAVEQLIGSVAGGYVAVTGPAGIGKSTLVQDVLSEYPFFVPYFAYTNGGGSHDSSLIKAL